MDKKVIAKATSLLAEVEFTETGLTFIFSRRMLAEEFCRYLAGLGLIFQVDYVYDLKRSVSYVSW